MGTPVAPEKLHHSQYHFPQLDDGGHCAKMIRSPLNGSSVRCGQNRDGDRHLYYPCLADRCTRRFWSIDMRLEHMEKKHRVR